MNGARAAGRLSTVLLVVGVVAALVVATRLSRHLFERPSRIAHKAVAGSAAADGTGTFNVVAAEGQVQVLRGGGWTVVKQGDILARDDVVRTSASARAVLRLSMGTEVELRERVEIRLDRLSAAGVSVDLRRGKVVARVATPQDGLAITALRTRTSSEGPAHFVVQADERGQVSVAALEGSAKFVSGGKTVTVPAGRQTRSLPGQPPEEPEMIPEEVLLQVVWPTGEKHGDTTPIEGRVSPSAVVNVNGVPAAVGADGHFSAEVPLREGPNDLDVGTEDLSGRTRRESSTVMRRLVRPPKLSTEPGELWKK